MRASVYKKISDGIVYAFQYGVITEKAHFKLLDKLQETHVRDEER